MIQGTRSQLTKKGPERLDVTVLNGTLNSGTLFKLQLIAQRQDEPISHVQISLSNGQNLSASIPRKDFTHNNELSAQERSLYTNLEGNAKVMRVYECGDESLRTQKSTLKHLEEGVHAIKTVGTAACIDLCLIQPCASIKNVTITGFTKAVRSGEPVEYVDSYEDIFRTPDTTKQKLIFYTPSVVGERKNKEMRDALKAGYYVLAEKPPFANADIAKDFISKLDDEQKNRIFFGWHYPHHSVTKKISSDISKGILGKIKHIRAESLDPRICPNEIVFDTKQEDLGFNHKVEVLESKIKSSEHLDPSNKDLAIVDFEHETKIRFDNGVTADFYSTFSPACIPHVEIEILFEDGIKLFVNEPINLQRFVKVGSNPTFIQKPGSERWDFYLSDQDLKGKEANKTSYEQQIEFMQRQTAGIDRYDM